MMPTMMGPMIPARMSLEDMRCESQRKVKKETMIRMSTTKCGQYEVELQQTLVLTYCLARGIAGTAHLSPCDRVCARKDSTLLNK